MNRVGQGRDHELQLRGLRREVGWSWSNALIAVLGSAKIPDVEEIFQFVFQTAATGLEFLGGLGFSCGWFGPLNGSAVVGSAAGLRLAPGLQRHPDHGRKGKECCSPDCPISFHRRTSQRKASCRTSNPGSSLDSEEGRRIVTRV